MPDRQQLQPQEPAALWTVFCHDQAFAIVRARDAAAAVERVYAITACSCLEKLRGQRFTARQAEEAEASRWLQSGFDHLFQCPVEAAAAISMPAIRSGRHRRPPGRRGRRQRLLATSLAALMLLPITVALAAAWPSGWTASIRKALGLSPEYPDIPQQVAAVNGHGGSHNSPEAGRSFIRESSPLPSTVAGGRGPAGDAPDISFTEHWGTSIGGPEPHRAGANAAVSARSTGDDPKSPGSPGSSGAPTGGSDHSGTLEVGASNPSSQPSELALFSPDLTAPILAGSPGTPPGTLPPLLTNRIDPPVPNPGLGAPSEPTATDPISVPEPASWILLLTCIAMLLSLGGRKKAKIKHQRSHLPVG